MHPIFTLNGTVDLFLTLCEPSQYARAQFQRVINASGYIGPIYFYASHHVANALATSKPIYNPMYPYEFLRYDRYIIYNPSFMRQMEFTSGNEFVTLSIFAHELGHHYYAHCDSPTSITRHPWDKEVEADSFSGYVLAKLNATSQDLEKGQRLMFSMWPTVTHPDSYQRISAIAKGWKEGGGIGMIEDDLTAIYTKINGEMNRWI